MVFRSLNQHYFNRKESWFLPIIIYLVISLKWKSINVRHWHCRHWGKVSIRTGGSNLNISHTVLLINFNVDLPLESSSSSVVELSVETFGSLEESFLDLAIDFAKMKIMLMKIKKNPLKKKKMCFSLLKAGNYCIVYINC